MKKLLYLSLVFLFVLLVGSTANANSYAFYDDFDDGDTNGWLFITGTWWVENQELRQQQYGDGFTALVDGMNFTTQEVRADMMFEDHGGYGGFDIWFQDFNNRVYILLYPAANYLAAIEYDGGVRTDYYHTIADMPNPQWHNLRVYADSTTGNIDIYLDGVYEFSYTATTSLREGKTSLFNGNSPLGGHFDNFSITTLFSPENREECMHGDWKSFNKPSFKNQGACVSYVESNRSK